MRKRLVIPLVAATAVLASANACASDADVASENISRAANQFEVVRRIVFINGITDAYLLTIEGRCSIVDEGHQLEVTCKVAPDEYEKHFLGLSDNVTYLAEQIETVDADIYHYRLLFRPEALVPSIDLETSLEEDR